MAVVVVGVIALSTLLSPVFDTVVETVPSELTVVDGAVVLTVEVVVVVCWVVDVVSTLKIFFFAYASP